jgi:hypothetical protein
MAAGVGATQLVPRTADHRAVITELRHHGLNGFNAPVRAWYTELLPRALRGWRNGADESGCGSAAAADALTCWDTKSIPTR